MYPGMHITVHVHMYRSTHVCKLHVHVKWAVSDFDGDFLPDFGTEDSPADYCARNSSLSPIALKIGLKVADAASASFEPMYVWFGLKLELRAQ